MPAVSGKCKDHYKFDKSYDMDQTILVTVITGFVSISVAALSFYLTKRAERKDALQQRKLIHYQELLSSISDLANDGTNKVEADLKLAKSVNTIALVAPQSVINLLMEYYDEIRISNPNRTNENHDQKLKALVLAIRKSIQLPFDDDPDTFNFHLAGVKLKQ
jgi:hypothetical protein